MPHIPPWRATLRAVRLQQTGGPDVLRAEEIPDPRPRPGEVLIDVAAAGVNFIDTYHRSGAYHRELPAPLGLEGAGRVAAVGADVPDDLLGARVAWADAAGSYAERALARADRVVPVPDGVSDEEAAALMLQGMTAHSLSHSTFPLGPDHTALVYAAAGGVGRLLVQLAKRRGARVLACTSTTEKAKLVRELGADQVILYRDVSVPEAVRRATDGTGVDVVFDSVGAATFPDSLASLRVRGLMVLFGQASGPVPPVDLQVLNRRGSLYVTRPSLGHYVRSRQELEGRATEVLELARAGEIVVHVHERYALDDAARAHADLESGRTVGKLLILP